MAAIPLVNAVVVNFNGKHLLGACLRSLRGVAYPRLQTIVVDNASTDGSAEFVREHFPEVRLIRTKANLGYGAAGNLGIRAGDGEFVLILNNDVQLDAGVAGELIAAASTDPKIGMAAPKILLEPDRRRIDSAGHLLYPDGLNRGRGHLADDRGQYERVEEVSHPSGCAALYRRAMLAETGLFDERFFMYGEDTDLGLRGRLAGWKCVYVPTAVAYHASSATAGQYSDLKAFLVERNRIWVALKNLPGQMLLLSLVFTLLRWFYQACGAVAGIGAAGRFRKNRGALALLAILVRAHLSAISGLPSVLAQRRDIQRRRKVSTSEVHRWFRQFAISAGELALKD